MRSYFNEKYNNEASGGVQNTLILARDEYGTRLLILDDRGRVTVNMPIDYGETMSIGYVMTRTARDHLDSHEHNISIEMLPPQSYDQAPEPEPAPPPANVLPGHRMGYTGPEDMEPPDDLDIPDTRWPRWMTGRGRVGRQAESAPHFHADHTRALPVTSYGRRDVG